MGSLERNRCQIDIKERVLHDKLYRAIENQVARNLLSWRDWTEGGYSAAFDEAWKLGMRDQDAITTYIMSVVGTRKGVNDIK